MRNEPIKQLNRYENKRNDNNLVTIVKSALRSNKYHKICHCHKVNIPFFLAVKIICVYENYITQIKVKKAKEKFLFDRNQKD